MNSSIYLFLLLLIANPAFSKASTNGDETNTCAKPRVVTQSNNAADSDSTISTPAATARPAPVRPRISAPRTVSPRWHSMLPGMFR